MVQPFKSQKTNANPVLAVESEVRERSRTPTKSTPIRKFLAEKVPEDRVGVVHKPTVKSFRDLENIVRKIFGENELGSCGDKRFFKEIFLRRIELVLCVLFG
jgi:hypothetical protein